MNKERVLADNCRVVETPPDQLSKLGVCGYKNIEKQKPFQLKDNWYRQQYSKGLRIKSLVTPEGSSQGMIEYIPGEFAWRPVVAGNYMFIHCLFVGYKKEYKGKAYASGLIHAVIDDARKEKKLGVAVVTRKSSFMAGKEIFLKNDFTEVDKAVPDFDLLAFKFDESSPSPSFLIKDDFLDPYGEGLFILRADQCPYSVKNVEDMIDVARKFGLNAEIINLKSHIDAQHSPCAFGTFCIILDGEVISYHPISGTRLRNILATKLP